MSQLLDAACAIAATCACYAAARWLHARAGRHPLLNPVALGAAPLIAALWLTEAPYARYAAGGDVLLWWLGPATCALALPALRHQETLRRAAWPLLAATLAGVAVSTVSALLLAHLFGASPETLRSIAPRSVTTAVALPLSAQLGGHAGLTALAVILTGVLGALIGPPLLRRAGVLDVRALGAALGACAHGIGAARGFQLDPLAGLFAGLAMTLAGLLVGVAAPLLARLFGW